MPDSLPAEYRAGKPQLVDQAVDFDIPKQVWSSWTPSNGRRALTRQLTAAERGVVALREQELRGALAPFGRFNQDAAIAAIAAMLGGFRSMRQTEEEAAAMLDGLRRTLAEFPVWAIEEGCLAIQQGRASVDGRTLDRRFPPNDAEVYGVIAELVRGYREALQRAQALLGAPVELVESARRR